MFNDPNFARQVIMDHYENPRNKRHEQNYLSKRMDSDSCIDDITVYVKLSNNRIEDISFDGVGCTISLASASMMSELIKGKTIDEARDLSKEYLHMIQLNEYDESKLKELVVFKNVGRQANRINCAMLSWRGLNAIINESEELDE